MAGSASSANVGPDQSALCTRVKPLIEEHLKVKFSEFTCVEALSQVVAGTNWFFKLKVAGDAVEKPCLWLKIFEQPWTSTLQVVGLEYHEDCDATMAFFDSNCKLDASACAAAPSPGISQEGLLAAAAMPEAIQESAVGNERATYLLGQIDTAEIRLKQMHGEMAALEAEKAATSTKVQEMRNELAQQDFYTVRLRKSERDNYLIKVFGTDTVPILKTKLAAACEEKAASATGKKEGQTLHSSQIDIFNDGYVVFSPSKSLRALDIGPGTELGFDIRPTGRR